MPKSNARMCIDFEIRDKCAKIPVVFEKKIWGSSGCVLIWQMRGNWNNKDLVFEYQNVLTKNKTDDTLSIQG